MQPPKRETHELRLRQEKPVSDSSANLELSTAIEIVTEGWGTMLNVAVFDVDSNEQGPIDFDILAKNSVTNLVVTTIPSLLLVRSGIMSRSESRIDIFKL